MSDQDHLRDNPSLPGHHGTAHPLDRRAGHCRGCSTDISMNPAPAALCVQCQIALATEGVTDHD